MTEPLKLIQVEVLRYRPEQDEKPYPATYTIPFNDDMSVLEALQYIKEELDSTLSYRWSCRMAICGSCGMMIDGVPALACHSFVRDYYPRTLRVEALDHFPVERDLVVAADDFIGKLESIKPYLVAREVRRLDQGEHLQTPVEREHYAQFSACINCMLCYAACPQYGMNHEFIGPGVMALLHRYNEDSRDGAREQRMELVNAEEGVWNCTAVGYCSQVCPKGVDPANAVNINKINSARDFFLGSARAPDALPMPEVPVVNGPGYVRPMAGWWRKNPSFIRYMLRESTALLVAIYALVLLAGLASLASGESAYNGWLSWLASPAGSALHVVALAAMLYHSWSWFEIMPKTMPPLIVRGKRVAAGVITWSGVGAAVASTLALFLIVWSLAS